MRCHVPMFSAALVAFGAQVVNAAAVGNGLSEFLPGGLIAGGGDPIRPLQTPKHHFSSMHIELLPVKPASDLRDLVLFGDHAPSKSPVAPEFEFDLPTERPGANPWTPASDTPERSHAGSFNSVPTPGPTALVVIAAAAVATPRRRRG